MSRARTVRQLAALYAVSVLLGACSLPADEGVTPIDADGLPPEIANTTTTSTTTSTTTTVPLPTSIPPETSAPTTPPPSTAPPASTSPVDIFYVDRATTNMQRLRRDLPEPLSLQSVITQLEQPPDDLSSYGLRTALVAGLIGPTTLVRSVLTVSLNGPVWTAMSDDEKRLAIAQIVLSFTTFAVPGEGNIGSVVIQVDGQPIPVYNPAAGTTVDPGTPLFFDDFAVMVVGTPGVTPTTAPPATSVPPTQTTGPPPF